MNDLNNSTFIWLHTAGVKPSANCIFFRTAREMRSSQRHDVGKNATFFKATELRNSRCINMPLTQKFNK